MLMIFIEQLAGISRSLSHFHAIGIKVATISARRQIKIGSSSDQK